MTKDDDKLKLSKNPNTQKEKEEDLEGLPQYMSALELSEEDQQRLVDEVMEEYEEIKSKRAAKIDSDFELWRNQYAGKLEDLEGRQFNLHKPTTKIKIDSCVRFLDQAYFEMDPIFAISPRPEYMRQGGQETCQNQQDFLDYKFDSIISIRQNIGKVFHNSATVGLGIAKVYHEVIKEKRKREEKYKGNPMPVIDPRTGQPVIDPNTNQVLMTNTVLKEFLTKFPEAPKDYPGYVQQLMEGKEINILVEYTETIYNDPMIKSVMPENFYVRLECDKLDGLKTERLIGERLNYTWWELKDEEKCDNFFNVDKLIYRDKEGKTSESERKGYKTETYDVMEFVYKFAPKGEDEIKIVCWIAEREKILLGAFYYPYETIPCYYIPFYCKNKKEGFYEDGLAADLTDSNLAEDAILNFTLEGAWISQMVTPIVDENSPANDQFLSKEWMHGVPINGKPGEIDFLQKYMKPTNTTEMLQLLQYLLQQDDEVSGITTTYASGRADPVDPTAPASKTIALMERSGLNVKDYILKMLPSFNELAYVILNMYYQISREGRKYAKANNSNQVVGIDAFSEISRDQMIARTNIQAQAYAFDFNKINEKREDVALYSMIRQENMVASSPQAVHSLLRQIVQGWSPKWRNMIDRILPSLQQMQQQQAQVAVQAVAQYVQAKVEETKLTGLPPVFDPQQLMQTIMVAVKDYVTPPSPEEIKARQG